ncbi:MAG: TAT-variant-translocated molybdopterin oxidoreductase [Aureliella sp.]
MTEHGRLPIVQPETTWWRSLAEYARDPQLEDSLHREFPRGASELTGESRREFLKLMTASLLLASGAGCDIRQPLEAIVPAAREADQTLPGTAAYYTTALDFAGSALGLVVECRDGRPIKVEGNPRHPTSLGSSSIFAQALTLELYDPDRARAPRYQGGAVGLKRVRQMLTATRQRCDQHDGQGLRVLIGASTSPTLARLLGQMTERWPKAKWSVFEPVNDDRSRSAIAASLGGSDAAAAVPVYDFSKARVVVSVDFDFLSARDQPVCYVRQFADARRIAGRSPQQPDGAPEQVQLFHLGPLPTVTSSKADHCLFAKPTDVTRLVIALARKLEVDFSGLGEQLSPATGAALSEPSQAWLGKVVRALQQAGANSIVAAGREQPPLVHWLVHAINAKQNAFGRTVQWIESPQVRPAGQTSDAEMWRQLVAECEAGEVDTLVCLGGDPVGNSGRRAEVADALRKVDLSVALASAPNATSDNCKWLIPRTHVLEAWGDARAHNGTASIVQPMLMPLHQSLSDIQLLATLLDDAPSAYEAVRKTWREHSDATEFEALWRQALADGLIADTTFAAIAVSWPTELSDELVNELSDELGDQDVSAGTAQTAQTAAGGTAATKFELLLRPDPSVWDGRFANNAWLQELPKPLTHLVWDNAAWMASADAAERGLNNGDLVALQVGAQSVEVPIWIVPGHATGCVSLFAGYGQATAGRIAMECGFDVRPLLGDSSAGVVLGTLARTGRSYPLVSTQHHQLMEGRSLARAGTLEEYLHQPDAPDFARSSMPTPEASLYPEWKYEGHKWGMSIDLTACVGCSACVIACQAENNIPVVGKQECSRNRQMHWIRVDTYYQGSPEQPQKTLHQPVPCMHCERAPCELVCPVAATTHSDEGLNQMIYNRCIGTRYCSNNCPYKVRRFNFFDYSRAFISQPSMVLLPNPEVTLRSRGVMEKCTYCVQRIERGVIGSEVSDRPLRDGDIQTACQSACPAAAIRFGDLNDPSSQVKHAHEHPLAYDLLEELNTKPRTRYLAEVFHP